MQVVTFDNKPAVIQYNADGTYYYNTDIKEVEIPYETGADNEAKTEKKWQALQYTIHNPLTKANITRSVILEYWDKDEQEKLINEYNSAILGVLTNKEEKDAVKSKYKAFLEERKTLIEKIDADLKDVDL